VTSTKGLRRLAREHPIDWSSLLIDHAPPPVVDLLRATVAEALRDPKVSGQNK
jgi:hypothetical protein